MTTKKKPPTNQPAAPLQIPAEWHQKRLCDLSIEDRLWLTLQFLDAGISLKAIAVARRRIAEKSV